MSLSLYRNVCLRRDDVTLSHIVCQQTDNCGILRITAVRAQLDCSLEKDTNKYCAFTLWLYCYSQRMHEGRKQGCSSRSLFVRSQLRKLPGASRAYEKRVAANTDN